MAFDSMHRSAVIPFASSGGYASTPSWTSPSSSVAGAYGAAVNQNAEDYDKLMGRYDTLFNQAQENRNRAPVAMTPLTAQTRNYTAAPQYQQSGRLNEVSSQLSDMSQTGGYSDADINAFRARGLSPIRAMYAAAQQNLKRQRAIQGGYSPNYGAMQAKMAREQGYLTSERTSALNADIADRVAKGKQYAISNLAPIAQRESELRHDVNLRNTEGVNRVNELNAADTGRVNELNAQLMLEIEKLNSGNANDAISQGLQANAGAANLYGTTPALTNMFGNQVLASNGQNLQAQQAEAGIRQARAGSGVSLVGMGAQPIRNISYGGATIPRFG
jgi:hypothetical protein